MKKIFLILLLASLGAEAYTKDSPSSGFKMAGINAFGNPEYRDEAIDMGARFAQLKIISTDVKTLNRTPLLAVTSPGTGKALLPVAVYATMDFRSKAYTYTGAKLNLFYGGQASTGQKAAAVPGAFLTNSSDKSELALVSTGINPLEDTALYVNVDTSNPTVGDSDIYLRVYYRIVPTLLTE